VFLQKGAVLLVWNKFDGLMRGEPANAGKSGVEWGLRLTIIWGVCQEVVDCLIHYIAAALYRLAHDCAEMFDELDAHEACLFVNFAQGCLLKCFARVNVAFGQDPLFFAIFVMCQGEFQFTFDLAQELAGSGVTVNALHPATYMATTMVRDAGVVPVSTVEEGARAILKLARAAELEGRSGLYFQGMQEARANPQAYDGAARQRLAALSRRLTGL